MGGSVSGQLAGTDCQRRIKTRPSELGNEHAVACFGDNGTGSFDDTLKKPFRQKPSVLIVSISAEVLIVWSGLDLALKPFH